MSAFRSCSFLSSSLCCARALCTRSTRATPAATVSHRTTWSAAAVAATEPAAISCQKRSRTWLLRSTRSRRERPAAQLWTPCVLPFAPASQHSQAASHLEAVPSSLYACCHHVTPAQMLQGIESQPARSEQHAVSRVVCTVHERAVALCAAQLHRLQLRARQQRGHAARQAQPHEMAQMQAVRR